MAQSAGTYLKAEKHNNDTTKKTADIRWTDREKEEIREESLACYMTAKKIQRITNEQDTNPTFETVTQVMKLLMGLEERTEEVREDVCYLLEHKPNYTVVCDKRFYEEMENIRDITDVAVKKCILGAREFFQNIDDIDGLFASHQSDCNYIIESMEDYTENRRGKPSTRKALTVLTNDLKRWYKT